MHVPCRLPAAAAAAATVTVIAAARTRTGLRCNPWWLMLRKCMQALRKQRSRCGDLDSTWQQHRNRPSPRIGGVLGVPTCAMRVQAQRRKRAAPSGGPSGEAADDNGADAARATDNVLDAFQLKV